MTAWTEPAEWEPALRERVTDLRHATRGATGVVTACERYGHFADPYWRATVRWDDGRVEAGIETSWLAKSEAKEAA